MENGSQLGITILIELSCFIDDCILESILMLISNPFCLL